MQGRKSRTEAIYRCSVITQQDGRTNHQQLIRISNGLTETNCL
jgi:hypothetical protein